MSVQLSQMAKRIQLFQRVLCSKFRSTLACVLAVGLAVTLGNRVEGQGYAVGDYVVVTGGTPNTSATINITQVSSSGAIQGFTVASGGSGFPGNFTSPGNTNYAPGQNNPGGNAAPYYMQSTKNGTITTTLTNALTATTGSQTITIGSTAGIGIDDVIGIGGTSGVETMAVTAVPSGTTLTVTRAYNGGTAVAHQAGAPVYGPNYCIFFYTTNTTNATVGSPQTGGIQPGMRMNTQTYYAFPYGYVVSANPGQNWFYLNVGWGASGYGGGGGTNPGGFNGNPSPPDPWTAASCGAAHTTSHACVLSPVVYLNITSGAGSGAILRCYSNNGTLVPAPMPTNLPANTTGISSTTQVGANMSSLLTTDNGIVSGGSGYAVASGLTTASNAVVQVTQVSPSLTFTMVNGGSYSAAPTGTLNSIDLTTTAASGAQFTLTMPTVGTAYSASYNYQATGATYAGLSANPGITASSATLAASATSITINGRNFSSTSGNNSIVFSGAATGFTFGSPTATGTSQLTVPISGTGTVTGPLYAVVTVLGVGNSGTPVQVGTVVASPTVSSSTTSLLQNATSLTISGTNFSSTSVNNTVAFTGATAGFTFGSPTVSGTTTLTIPITGTGTATGAISAVVTVSGAGSSGTPVQVATVVALPSVTASAANLGQNATSIIIMGVNFSTISGNNTVAFSGASAGFTFGSPTATGTTQLTIPITGTGTATGALNAIVTVSGVGSSGSAVQVATIVPPPTLSSVFPAGGPVTAGATVTLNGANLAGATSVTFGGLSATIAGQTTFAMCAGSTTAVGTNPTFMGEVAADVANGGTGTNNVAINLANLTASYPNVPQALFQNYRQGVFTYTIPNLQPNSSCSVVLFFCETYFTSANQRNFNVSINGTQVLTNFDVYATAGAVNKATAQQFSATANASGQIIIAFTNGSTNQAQLCGGVMINGTFTNSLTVTPPAITTGGGVVSVVVTTVGGTGSTTYSYLPVVSSVTPNAGLLTPSSAVTITGNGFTGTTSVQFGNASVAPTSVSETSVTVSPPTASAAGYPSGGTVAVSVTAVGTTASASATSTTTGSYSYLPPPTITSYTSTSGPVTGGPVTGGTAIGILGTNLTGVTGVTFAGQSASVLSGSSTFAMCAGGTLSVGTNPTFISEVAADTSGGATGTNVTTINLANLATAYPNVPQALFQNFRQGNFTYTIPGLTANADYSVVLFFCEEYFSAANSRQFNVTINGTQVLTNFDVYAAAGGRDVATYQQFTVPANASGQIVIAFTTGAHDQPQLCGGVLINPILTVTPPAISSGGGVVTVAVTTTYGTATGTYSYLPVVASITPNTASLTSPTAVTIAGNGFTGTTSVQFGNASVTPSSVSETSITVVPPSASAAGFASGGTAAVSVTAQGTAASASATSTTNGSFSYVPPPTITSFTPSSGPVTGGPSVGIVGTNLSAATSVTFSGQPATILSSSSTFAMRAGSTTSVGTNPTFIGEVASYVSGGGLQNNTAAINISNLATAYPNVPASLFANCRQGVFTYTIPGFTPNGDYTVVLFFCEEYWTAANSRQFNVTINGTQVLTNFDVYATAGGKNIAIYQQFTATANSSGQIVIAFTNGAYDQPQLDGGVLITPFLTVTPPAITTGAGTVSVAVTTPFGSTTGTYNYLPVVSSVTANTGPLLPSAAVTIAGNGFTGTTSVKFGTGSVVPTSVSETSITVVPPTASAAGFASGGAAPVSVTAQGTTASAPATSTTNGTFTYSVPTITSVSPGSVDIGGGTKVTVAGRYFTGATAISLAGVSAASFTVVSDTQINAVAAATGAGVTGPVKVSVGSVSGSGSTFVYGGGSVGSIATVPATTPPNGPLTGNTTVVITGVGFTNATGVSFGNTPAQSYTVNSDTQITAVSPAVATAGPVNINVMVGGLESSFTTTDQFTYQLYFNYSWTTWSSLNWSTPMGSTITWNSQSIPVAFNLSNGFYSWYAPATAQTVNSANGAISGTAWGVTSAPYPFSSTTPFTPNIAGTPGMDGPFANNDPSGNTGTIVSGDWKDFATGQLSYYGPYSNGTAWNNPVFWSYYNILVTNGQLQSQYSVTATTTTITNNAGYQYFLTADGVPSSPLGRTSYVGNSGMYYFNSDTSNPGNAKYSNGPLYQDSRVSITEIQDGSSNTIFFGESLGGPDNALPTYQLTWMGTGTMPSYWDCQTPSQYFMFSSMHPGVVNFAFCDGSVRSITKITASVPPDSMGTQTGTNTGDGTNTNTDAAMPPKASNPATPRWIAFQLMAGANDGGTPDLTLLGLTP